MSHEEDRGYFEPVDHRRAADGLHDYFAPDNYPPGVETAYAEDWFAGIAAIRGNRIDLLL